MSRKSLDLLEKLRDAYPQLSERQLSLDLGLSAGALKACRTRDNLTPGIAGRIALRLQLTPAETRDWVAMAGIEGEKAAVPRRLWDVLHAIA